MPDRATVLKKLYQRRLRLKRALVKVNEAIAIGENSRYISVHAVHFDGSPLGCPSGRKLTKDWSMVDCIVCLKRRAKEPRRDTWPKKGEDWADTVKKVK